MGYLALEDGSTDSSVLPTESMAFVDESFIPFILTKEKGTSLWSSLYSLWLAEDVGEQLGLLGSGVDAGFSSDDLDGFQHPLALGIEFELLELVLGCVLVESSLVLGCFPHTFLDLFSFEDPLVQGPVHLGDIGVEFLSPLDLGFLLPAIITVLCLRAELYLIVLLDHDILLLVPEIKLIDLNPSWVVEIKTVVSERIDRDLRCCLPCVRSLSP